VTSGCGSSGLNARAGLGRLGLRVRSWEDVMRVLLVVVLVVIAGCGGQETLTLKGHSDAVINVSFSPDGKRLACARDKSLEVWDVHSLTKSK